MSLPPSADAAPPFSERDLASAGYREFLIQKHGIQRNEALKCYTLGIKIFNSLHEALVYADRLETVSQRKSLDPPV